MGPGRSLSMAVSRTKGSNPGIKRYVSSIAGDAFVPGSRAVLKSTPVSGASAGGVAGFGPSVCGTAKDSMTGRNGSGALGLGNRGRGGMMGAGGTAATSGSDGTGGAALTGAGGAASALVA